MPTLSITRNYSDGNTLTEAMLDAVCDSVETFLNTTGIGSDNIQDAAITTAKINALAVTTAKIDNLAVTTGKIANANVTAEKLADAISAVKTTTYTISSTDSVVRCDSSGGAFTVTLPTAAGITGRRYIIVKTDSTFATANAITIDADGAETIDGSANTTLNTQYESVEVVSDGTNWLITNRRIPNTPTSYTPTTAAFGSITSETTTWQRVGSLIKISTRFTSGTPTGSTATFSLPSGLTASLPSGSNMVVGNYAVGSGSTDYQVLCSNGASSFTFAAANSTAQLTNAVGTAVAGTTDLISFDALLPITGWKG